MDAIVDSQMLSANIDVQMIEVGGQQLQVAIKRGPKGRPPLLIFNGIGANWGTCRAIPDRVETDRSDHF
jgi:hypothetical protein